MSSELERIDEEELLLIISGLGMPQEPTPENPEPDYWVSDECRECLSDLQRYLRRDDPMVLAAHRALGSWRVLQTHLIPLLQATGDSDTKLAFNVLKVIVKITMKPEQLGTCPDRVPCARSPRALWRARLTRRVHRVHELSAPHL